MGVSLNVQSTEPTIDFIAEIEGKKYQITELTGTYNQLRNQLQQSSWTVDFENPWYGYFLIELNNRFPNYKPNTMFLTPASPIIVYDEFEGDSETFLLSSWIDDYENNGITGTGFRLSEYGNIQFSWLFSLLLGPSPQDTLITLLPNASAMKNAFNSQYATLAYGLNHDCTIYDSNGVCVSVFGRNTSLNDSAFDNNAAGLVLGYKPHAQFRIGTYIDQSLDSNTTAGVKVERSNPDVGVFGVWNMNADGSGLELRAAANYGKRDLNVARSVVGTAEAGSGRSDLNAYGALLEASFAYAMNDSWMAKPYAGVRYLSIKRDSYTERLTDAVQNPLSYSGLKQETTSAVVGVRFNGQLAPKVIASLNAGLEHDLHHSIDDYRATGVDDLGTINMDSQKDRTRPTAGVGISYDVADKQRLAANVQYRKEVFMSESSTTGQVTYTIGF